MDAVALSILATLPPVEHGAQVPSSLPAMLIAAGLLIILFLAVRHIRKRAEARAGTELTPRERIEAIRASAAQRESAEAVMAEMHDLARELAAQLEARSAKLERLIRDADERLARLHRTRDGGAATNAPPPSSPQPGLPADPLHTRVYELADRGMRPVEIAREIDRPTGQIELILALRRTG